MCLKIGKVTHSIPIIIYNSIRHTHRSDTYLSGVSGSSGLCGLLGFLWTSSGIVCGTTSLSSFWEGGEVGGWEGGSGRSYRECQRDGEGGMERGIEGEGEREREGRGESVCSLFVPYV